MADIIYVSDLLAGGMTVELEELGPVEKGDKCLMSAAILMDIVADLYPPGSPAHKDIRSHALEYFRAVVQYYPDSEHADTAQDYIAELS